MWEYTLTGARTPFKLLVEQAAVPVNEWGRTVVYPIACSVETAVWSISAEGKIEKRVLSDKRGAIAWDSTEYRRIIFIKDTLQNNVSQIP